MRLITFIIILFLFLLFILVPASGYFPFWPGDFFNFFQSVEQGCLARAHRNAWLGLWVPVQPGVPGSKIKLFFPAGLDGLTYLRIFFCTLFVFELYFHIFLPFSFFSTIYHPKLSFSSFFSKVFIKLSFEPITRPWDPVRSIEN